MVRVAGKPALQSVKLVRLPATGTTALCWNSFSWRRLPRLRHCLTNSDRL